MQKSGNTRTSRNFAILPELVPAASPRALFPWVQGHIALGLSAATRDGPQPLFPEDLGRWRTSPDTIFQAAVDNLRKSSSPRSWRTLHALPELRVYLSDDGRSASRALLIGDLVPDAPFSGVIAAIPSADQLMILPLERVESVSMLQILVQTCQFAYQASDAPLSDQLFWFDGYSWFPVAVRQAPDTIEVVPPSPMLERVKALAGLSLAPGPAEA